MSGGAVLGAIAAALILTCLVVGIIKGRYVLAVVGVLIPIVGVIGGLVVPFLDAKPGSWWHRRRSP